MFEINLVPDVKAEMIKAQKMRNLVYFVSGTVAAIAIGFVVLLVTIKAGQDIKLSTQDNQLELLSGKLEEYDGLDEILTVQSQLSNLEAIGNNKKMLSRIFMILAAFMPSGDDEVTISKLDVDLDGATLNVEGQAKAGATTDGLNYRVLEAFKKQIGATKYDYGRYVDKNGNEIPTMCIDDVDSTGIPYSEVGEKNRVYLYAWWNKGKKGCDPSKGSSEMGEEDGEGNKTTETDERVKIYRTPRNNGTEDDWYEKGYMTLDGEISRIEHFESQCISWTGTMVGSKAEWKDKNECDLADLEAGYTDGVDVSNSSNGRETGGDLVLRFEATVYLNPEVLSYRNKHLIAIAPTGKTNVTDSYNQIKQMFSEKAMDCEEGDTACKGGK